MAIIVGTGRSDTLAGGSGNDVVFALAGRDTAWGGNGDDYLGGGAGVDLLYGDAGDDILEGGDHDDILKAGDGDDLLRGGRGADQLGGDADDDTVWGEGGNDRLSGGDGNDWLRGAEGNDSLDGGDGTDIAQFRGNAAGYRITANGDGTVTVADIRLRDGWDGVDTLDGVERLRFADQVIEIRPSLDVDAVVAYLSDGTSFKILVNQGGDQGGAAGDFVRDPAPIDDANRGLATPALGDLDDDGDLDAIVLNNVNLNQQILINQGGAQQATEGSFLAIDIEDSATSLSAVALGDVDGDGDLDALAIDPYGGQLVLVNQGGDQQGDIGTLVAEDLPAGCEASALALGDLDGDGDLDAIIGSQIGDRHRILVNQGEAQLGSQGEFVLGASIGGGAECRSVELGDLDGDGDLDAWAAQTFGAASEILWNQGYDQAGTEGDFVAEAAPGDSGSVRAVALGDVDNDGDLDAVVGSYNDDTKVLLNQGGSQLGTEGEFELGQTIPGRGSSALTVALALGDIDADGDLDMLVSTEGFAGAILVNQGGAQDGTLGLFVAVSDPPVELSDSRAIALGDLDGDGNQVLTDGGLPFLGAGLAYADEWVA